MTIVRRGLGLATAVALLLAGVSATANAGIIIDGTDANDHGSVSGGSNVNGWFYMQSALTALAGSNNAGTAKVLVDLGTSSGQARSAIDSAFDLSGLGASGWTIQHVDGAANISTYLSSLSTSNTGILYLPTYNNASGDLDLSEMSAINADAAKLDAFTLAGGSLFAMGESNSGSNTGAYGWLNTLIPGLVAINVGTGGISSNITLTADGMSAFPGLTNTDLAGADPWHVYFTGSLGGLQVLGTAPNGAFTRNLILGNVGGSITTSPVPEPSTLISAGIAGLVGLGVSLRRRQAKSAA